MAWLARSLANSLNLTGDGDGDGADAGDDPSAGHGAGGDPSAGDSPRGVKEDLTELSHTLSRQFWGVASFLAPPVATVESDSGEWGIGGFRGDLAEIGGRFRSGISRLSNHQAVAEISKIASSLIGPIESEEEEEAVVGVTEEVLAFAKNISMHPETWLDFPLFVDDEDDDGQW